jgi:hypothetical protein
MTYVTHVSITQLVAPIVRGRMQYTALQHSWLKSRRGLSEDVRRRNHEWEVTYDRDNGQNTASHSLQGDVRQPIMVDPEHLVSRTSAKGVHY